MINFYFKQTMDYFGIRGSVLANRLGCSRNNISEIRNGKSFPPINRFWEIVEVCEELAPGFRQELARRIAENRTLDYDDLDDNQLAEQLYQISKVWKRRHRARELAG